MNKKVDHSSLPIKVELRRRHLQDDAVVLDLFAGHGLIYDHVYRGRAQYQGVDKKIQHNLMVDLADNRDWIKRNDLTKFNVFDLDDYGSPWKLLFKVIEKAGPQALTMFVTDTIPRANRKGEKSALLNAIERLPADMKVPGLSRFYPDIFATMLTTAAEKYGRKIDYARYVYSPRHTVCYWAIGIKRKP